MSAHKVDFLILGAGLAGMHMAFKLCDEGAEVALVDPFGIAKGASGTPLGLVNPATGRFATKSWEAERGVPAIKSRLDSIQSITSNTFFSQGGILRPALSEKIARRMQDNLSETSWPEGWVQWMSEQDVQSMHPGIEIVNGAVWVPIGMTVDVGAYLAAVHTHLSSRGVSFILDDYTLTESKPQVNWELQTKDIRLHANDVIDCRGIYATDKMNWWDHLTFHAVKGQLASLEHDPKYAFDHAVSALGYISSLEPGKVIIGSTYEHTFDDEEPDGQGLTYLLERLGRVLPELISTSRVSGRWAGVRASTPDRMPYIGPHPTREHLFVFSGLGSKGLLYSAFGAELLSSYILAGKEIPQKVHSLRFEK